MQNDVRRNGAGPIDPQRRTLIGAAGAGMAVAALGSALSAGIARAATHAPLRWGVVGTGGIANSMAPRIIEADGAALAAVSSRRMETAREFADAHEVPNAFDSWEEMCASDAVDAIYVATPHPQHADWVLRALRAGKHVLCEKPLSLSAAEADAVAAYCRERGVLLMEAFMWRHTPQAARLVELAPGDPLAHNGLGAVAQASAPPAAHAAQHVERQEPPQRIGAHVPALVDHPVEEPA